MSAEIHYLRSRPSPIGQFIRVGTNGYRQLETLHAAGRIHIAHAVIDAAQMKQQSDLVQTLRESGTDIVLDSGVAELSSIGRFDGSVKNVGWANADRPLDYGDFGGSKKKDIVKKIAEFSVGHGVDTVLVPTHFIKGIKDKWMGIDIQSCEYLREELNSAGGQEISIDYPLVIPYSLLRDSAERRAIAHEISKLPFDNLWMKVSGFGADATPVGVKRYISNIADFHGTGKAIVADCVGGLSALALCSFGAVTAISHGVGEKERFETNSWNIRPKKGGGGQSGRLYLPGLDRHFKNKEVEEIMKARGARILLSCNDSDCCALGYEDMKKDAKGHFMIQRRKQLNDLEKIQDDRRITRFIDHHLASADRIARQAARLKVSDESVIKALQKNTVRLDRMRAVLEDLSQTMESGSTRSATLKIRPSVDARNKHSGRET